MTDPLRGNTRTTRHLDDLNEDDLNDGVDAARRPTQPRRPTTAGYYENARQRTHRFAAGAREMRSAEREIASLSSSVTDRPTGLLSGGDADIAYHYLGLTLGVLATLYSAVGSVFALSRWRVRDRSGGSTEQHGSWERSRRVANNRNAGGSIVPGGAIRCAHC